MEDHATTADSEVVQSPPEDSVPFEDNAMSPQGIKTNHQPLRATASSFYARSIPHDDPTVPPNVPLQINLGLATSVSIPQNTPTANATPSPRHRAYHHHAHNISFYPRPPPISPSDPSSPSRSLYQGYTYNTSPVGYAPHAHPSSHYVPPHQPTYVSPGQDLVQQSPYYGNVPPFSTLGSQAPLTPSATPLDAVPESWKLPHSFSNLSFENGTSVDFQPHYRSDSRSTLRSDNVLSGDIGAASGRPEPLQIGTKNGVEWQTAEADGIHGVSTQRHLDEAPLAEHLLHHFNNPEYSDCQLVLTHDEKRFPETYWSLSSILLIQSKKLQDLFKSSKAAGATEYGRIMLELKLTDRFITPASMDLALRVLYGMSTDAFVPTVRYQDLTQAGSESTARLMSECLAYAASGCLLELKGVVLQGLQSACEIISWGNLETALSFALESGPEREGHASSSVIPEGSPPLARDSNPSSSSRVVFTPSSSGDHVGQRSDRPSTSSPQSKSCYHMLPQSADDLLLLCWDFIIRNFPTSWELDLSARPLAYVDRLPVTAESRSPLSKSRLSRIQFGDQPSEAAAKANDVNVLLSSILLSIPFAKLDYLLASVGEPLARNIGLIVEERERRRQTVLQSKSVPWSERMAARTLEWAEVGYEESVETSEGGNVKMVRRYTGVCQDKVDEDTIG